MTIRRLMLGALVASVSACGPAIPTHIGYPDDAQTPWTKPVPLKLTQDNYAKADGTVSYPLRERAAWYVVDLPMNGQLAATIEFDPKYKDTDLGMEILDEGFNIKVKATTDDDEGQTKKTRTLADAHKGKNYIHIFTLGKLDAADFTVKVSYTPTPPPPPPPQKSNFPGNVPNLPTLAAVPPADDTPVHHSSGTPKPAPPVDNSKKVRAGVLQFHLSGSSVQVDLDKGSDAGVDEGWTGYLVDANGNTLGDKGSFSVKNVKADGCTGVVSASPDEVNAHPYAVLKPPK